MARRNRTRRSNRTNRKGGSKRTVRKGRKMRSKKTKPLATICIDVPGTICKF